MPKSTTEIYQFSIPSSLSTSSATMSKNGCCFRRSAAAAQAVMASCCGAKEMPWEATREVMASGGWGKAHGG